ncbi:MAG TPA: ABC transporter ATP-binding protein [Deltaproteobacteria bacterium]|nr:ABC transporter ATP-binding protein [Deltaproteobacteria bacterium]
MRTSDDGFIRIDGVSVHFGSTCAVDGVSLDVRRGSIFGLLGSDGAGKSTLLRVIAGMVKPTSGRVFVQGIDALAHRDRLKPLIGYMPQRFGLYEDLTVGENMDFFLDVLGLPAGERRQRRSRYLEFSGLSPFVDRLAGRLSGGMKQKLGLACVLLAEPLCLVLDEPTNGVDPVARTEFWDILAHMQGEGVTILVSTAYMDEGERCSDVAVIHRSRLLVTGEPGLVRGAHRRLEDAVRELIAQGEAAA